MPRRPGRPRKNPQPPMVVTGVSQYDPAMTVAALERAGMPDAARAVADAAGIPPRPLTPDEDFIATVRAVVTDCAIPVGFNCADEAEARRREELVTAMEPAPGRHFEVRRKGARLEVSLR